MDKFGLWRILVGAAITVVMALSGWSLNAVANMPKEYVMKDEFTKMRQENRQDHKEIMQEIRKILQRGE